MADFCGTEKVVARPEGAYHRNSDAGLIWLTGPKTATDLRQPRRFLANGPMGVCSSTPALNNRARKRPMPSYPLSEKLRAVRDSLTFEEFNLLCQERIDGYMGPVYQQGLIDGRAKLLREQRDERERRKIGRGRKEFVTVIYFIRSPSAVKIGMAKDANRRLTVLQTSHPEILSLVATSPGGRELEAEYHRRFTDHRIRGEWFTPEEAAGLPLPEIDRALLEGIAKLGAPPYVAPSKRP
jgi:hypothetical protein